MLAAPGRHDAHARNFPDGRLAVEWHPAHGTGWLPIDQQDKPAAAAQIASHALGRFAVPAGRGGNLAGPRCAGQLGYQLHIRIVRFAHHDLHRWPRLADAHARFSAWPWVQDVDARVGFLVSSRSGHHHAFGNTELHLARRQVGYQHGQLADQLFRFVGRADAREYIAVTAFACIQGQTQQLVRTFNQFAIDDLGDAQVDLEEIVDLDLWRQFFDVQGCWGCNLGHSLSYWSSCRYSRLRCIKQRFDHLRVHARHQMAVGADGAAQHAVRHGVAKHLRIGPAKLLVVQERGHIFGHARQYRRQQDGQLAEQDQGGGADIVQLSRLVGILGQYPRFVFIDILVGDVGDFHDFAQGLAEFAVFKVLGDAGLALDDHAIDVMREGAADPRLRAVRQGACQLAIETLGDKAGATAGDIHVFADQVAVYAGHEVVAVEVQVFHFRVQLESDVVAQPFRVHAQVQVAQRRNTGAARLRHFFVVDRQEAVYIDFQFLDHRVAGKLQHGWPEQQVERDDVLADEVDLFGSRVVQQGVEIDAFLVAIVFQAGQVTDRRIHPNIEKLAWCIRNRDAEVRRIARNIPVSQLFARFTQPFADLVDHFRLQAAWRVQPVFQEFKAARVRQLEEILFRRLHHGRGVGEDREWIDQVGWLVSRTAHFAIVAILVLGAAFRAFALDVAVGQEHALDGVKEAVDGFRDDQARIAQFAVDGLRQLHVFRRIGRIPVVKGDMETVQVLGAAGGDIGDEFLRRDAFLFGGDHDRRAVRIVGAHQVHFTRRFAIALHALEPDPDIGLDIFHDVANVKCGVCVRQGSGDEQLPSHD